MFLYDLLYARDIICDISKIKHQRASQRAPRGSFSRNERDSRLIAESGEPLRAESTAERGERRQENG